MSLQLNDTQFVLIRNKEQVVCRTCEKTHEFMTQNCVPVVCDKKMWMKITNDGIEQPDPERYPSVNVWVSDAPDIEQLEDLEET